MCFYHYLLNTLKKTYCLQKITNVYNASLRDLVYKKPRLFVGEKDKSRVKTETGRKSVERWEGKVEGKNSHIEDPRKMLDLGHFRKVIGHRAD